MTKIEDLAKESFGKNCTLETNAHFLSLYCGEVRVALINAIQHKMILTSPDFLDGAQKFSEAYKQLVPEADNFMIFASYD